LATASDIYKRTQLRIGCLPEKLGRLANTTTRLGRRQMADAPALWQFEIFNRLGNPRRAIELRAQLIGCHCWLVKQCLLEVP
jgi:hypothetical protein